jgi:hypothetical protein
MSPSDRLDVTPWPAGLRDCFTPGSRLCRSLDRRARRAREMSRRRDMKRAGRSVCVSRRPAVLVCEWCVGSGEAIFATSHHLPGRNESKHPGPTGLPSSAVPWFRGAPRGYASSHDRHRTRRCRPRRRPQARLARRSAQAVVGLRRPQDPAGVLQGPVHRSRSRPHLLRRAGPVPGARRAGVDAGRVRAGAVDRRRPAEDRRPDRAGVRRRQPAADHRAPQHLAGRRTRARPGSARCAVVGIRLRRGVRPCDEPRVRDRGGSPHLEAAPGAAARDPREPGAGRRRRGVAGADGTRRRGGRRPDRPRVDGDPRLGHREVAGAAGRRGRDRRAALLRHPQREAAEVPLDERRCRLRDRRVDPRLGGIRPLRRDVLELRQDLRLAGRHHRVPALAVADQRRAAVRRRARRRARARTPAAGRHGRRGDDPAAAARHPQHREGRRQAPQGRRRRPGDPPRRRRGHA